MRTTKKNHVLLLGPAALALAVAACGSATPTATPSTTQAPTTSAPTTAAPTASVPSTPSTQGGAAPPVTATVNVFFLDTVHARTGEEPLFRPVVRHVMPPALAAGALDALFAGPTAAEKTDGLALVLSGATGYSGLHIDSGVAYVRLEGGCASGGSTMTIAGEIMPTLKQFASVDHVKIYAPDGTTEAPTGATDSIPECLEP